MPLHEQWYYARLRRRSLFCLREMKPFCVVRITLSLSKLIASHKLAVCLSIEPATGNLWLSAKALQIMQRLLSCVVVCASAKPTPACSYSLKDQLSGENSLLK